MERGEDVFFGSAEQGWRQECEETFLTGRKEKQKIGKAGKFK